LAQLPDQDREVLMLRNFEKMSNDEVALLLEINPEAAKKRHLRALLRLRKLWRQSGLPEP
jgi:RNA polymerase sigma-70 factor (ECF subfamily)